MHKIDRVCIQQNDEHIERLNISISIHGYKKENRWTSPDNKGNPKMSPVKKGNP